MEKRQLYEVQKALVKNGGPLPLSTAGIYKAIAEGKIPHVCIGRRKYIPGTWLEKMLADPTAKEV